jgi:phytoene dehydrogenase-like protein
LQKTILIIGGGIAGLAAGCYGQMNGFRTQVFEMHDLPGGLCTAWERKGYVFDGCLHYLMGSGEGQPYHRMWQELGAVQTRQFVDHAEYLQVLDESGRSFAVRCDPDELYAELTRLSPADEHLAEELAEGVRTLLDFDMSLLEQKPRPLFTPADLAALGTQMLPFVGATARFSLVSATDYARRFHDPFLRRAIPQMFAWTDIPMLGGLSLLAAMVNHNAGFPLGASLEFARQLERRYLALGGQIHYKAQVEKILLEDDALGNPVAVGVRLYSDEVVRGDYLVSAADLRSTLYDMLGKPYVPKRLGRLFDGGLPVYSQLQVSLGVRRDFSAEPHWATHLLDDPLLVAGQQVSALGVKHYCFDPSLAPAGKSSLVLTIPTAYSYWQRLYGRRPYDTEQDQAADMLIEHLARRYPGLQADIEVVDVATPLSYERYTGNWQGSCCGWLLTPKSLQMMIAGMERHVEGVANLYLAGHWLEPGGSVTLAAVSGRSALQLICAAEGQPFETTVA